ncbi:rod shape-determining protein RodA [Lentisphaerota bacterium ZTH]|nr:rod shape-determining protein RodA [Lentisphaerota bacterium]WET05434.1 rod shape-determining protein RodA [Lentisphaerota bacterium ZTH]
MISRRKVGGANSFFEKIISYAGQFDMLQLLSLGALLLYGLIFIYSTGEQIGTPAAASFWLKQVQWILLGICVWTFFAVGDYRTLKPLSWIIYAAIAFLLLLVLFFGTKVYGARRWLVFGGIGLRIQPSEFAKLSVILYLSALMSSHGFNINRLRSLLLVAAVVGVPFLLIVREPDLGSALILIPLTGAIIFTAGIKWRYIFTALIVATVVLTAEILNETYKIHPFLKDYQKERILTFLDPERDIQNRGYNQFQARLAVGSGGFTGKGIGKGTQNALGFLPQSVSNNDFIFSVIAEETGFFGCMVLLSTYILLLVSVLRTAFMTPDHYGRYIAVGMAAVIFSHMFINIGMSIGVSPVTGLSLPFVSYGGSFILFAMSGLGICQSIYRFRKEVA